MILYKNIYRTDSSRLSAWDYCTPWWYYITINTKNHQEQFGVIKNGKMLFNKLGQICEQEWLKTKELRNNIDLDYFIIMPNHIHGIIILNEDDTKDSRDVARNVSTETNFHSSIAPKRNSLSSIIRAFKSAVTNKGHKLGFYDFAWQTLFYDHIIRNDKELFRIRKYISENPLRWELEKNNSENIAAEIIEK